MQSYVKTLYIIMILTLIAFFVGIYGTTFANGGPFYIFGQAFSLYLLIVHPALLFGYARALLKISDHKNFPEVIIIAMLSIPFFPIVYTLVPIVHDYFNMNINISPTDVIFVVFEIAVMIAGIAFFVHYGKRYAFDKLVPRDLYAIHHYLLGTLVYFYFIRLTIISSILATGAF